MEKVNYIDKSDTNVIKGIALILMFVHHFFTLPSFWIDSVSNLYSHYNADLLLPDSFKICVPVFAFLTGYFYFFASQKNFRYSVKKISDLWINYFLVFILLMSLAVVLKVYDFSVVKFLAEAVALYRPTMVHCWYVVFYIIVMMLLPMYAKLSSKNDVLPFLIVVAVPKVVQFAIGISGVTSSTLSDIISYFNWLPIVATGFYVAKYDLFNSFSEAVKTKYVAVNLIIALMFIVVPFVSREINSNFDFVYAPMFVFGIVSLTKMIKKKALLTPLSVIGKYSLLMWFLHCAFANSCSDYTQPLLYYPKNPILVLIWGSLMCLAVAYIIDFPIKKIIKIKNKIMKL